MVLNRATLVERGKVERMVFVSLLKPPSSPPPLFFCCPLIIYFEKKEYRFWYKEIFIGSLRLLFFSSKFWYKRERKKKTESERGNWLWRRRRRRWMMTNKRKFSREIVVCMCVVAVHCVCVCSVRTDGQRRYRFLHHIYWLGLTCSLLLSQAWFLVFLSLSRTHTH